MTFTLPDSIKVMKYPTPSDGKPGIYEFICNTESDISSLPRNVDGVNPGSAAVVCSTAKVYLLNASNQWVEFGG